MKWIRNSCLEKVIATVISGIVLLIITFIFKKYLTTVFTFTFPLWAWIVLCVAISSFTAIILKVIGIRRRQEFLTDKVDISNKLQWWVGQQLKFVKEQTEDNKLVTWYFSVIDKRNKLRPGSAKQFLPEFFSGSSKLFPITLVKMGEKTISIWHDLASEETCSPPRNKPYGDNPLDINRL